MAISNVNSSAPYLNETTGIKRDIQAERLKEEVKEDSYKVEISQEAMDKRRIAQEATLKASDANKDREAQAENKDYEPASSLDNEELSG
ncbi:MAG: hypothetical protein GY714_00940 [Desulfobacterales bacterium]|nr:hypothetical protein [Desulfobacterales bacterium]